MQAVALSK